MGAIVTLLRADADVTAIVGSKVRGEVLTGEAPPLVVLEENNATTRPFGVGSGRIGVQLSTIIARCYGPDTNTGRIQARQLAGAVHDALDNHSPTTVGTKYLARVYAPELTQGRDPLPSEGGTGWPFVAVRIDVYAAAEVAA